MTVVVATADFELYHDLVAELRDRSARFTTIEPGDPLPEGTSVVITGPEDPLDVPADADVERIVTDPETPRRGVEAALAAGRRGSEQRVVGIDPGERPGVAVLEGEDVVSAFHLPVTEVPAVVREELEGAPDGLVRIGDGARLKGAWLVDELGDVRIELVDETGTTPHLGSGARGMGDVLAAVNIARRTGEPIESRDVEPTPGEIQTVKTAARERSPENRALPEALARRVAKGELTLEAALAEHRS